MAFGLLKIKSYVRNLAMQLDPDQLLLEIFPNRGEKHVATGLTWLGGALSSVGLWTLTDGVGWRLKSSALLMERYETLA